jgi:hypothetical protein
VNSTGRWQVGQFTVRTGAVSMEGLKGFDEWDYSQGAVVGMADRVGRFKD